jgi:hypothetical protein
VVALLKRALQFLGQAELFLRVFLPGSFRGDVLPTTGLTTIMLSHL